MGLTADVAARLGIEMRKAGSLELIRAVDADRFASAVQEMDLVIIGIEGFHEDGGHDVPDMSAIADFSTVLEDPERVALGVRGARQFFSDVSDASMWLDFVLVPNE
jgi:hypothetical protein